MPTPAQIGRAAGPGGSQDHLDGIPEQNPEATEGGAPAGPFFSEGELPVVAVPGGNPASLNGYRPSADQDKLPPPGSGDGTTLPPTGIRK